MTFDPWPDAQVHVEWGPIGAELAAARGDVVVVVDLLSFSTALTVVAERGGVCLPFTADELRAAGGRDAVAAAHDAIALGDVRALDGYTLSPTSLLSVRAGERLVVTSFNGAACTVAAAGRGAVAVMAGCLRNRAAVAARVEGLLRARDASRVTLVCCGERWSSVADVDGFRPSVEDWVTAGAIAAELTGRTMSPEAALAVAASAVLRHGDVAAWLRSTISGRELVAKGFAADADVAAAVDAADVVPVLDETRAFVGRTGRTSGRRRTTTR